MDKLLLNSADVLLSLGFEKDDSSQFDRLLDMHLPVVYPFGPDHPRVEPEVLRYWLETKLQTHAFPLR